MTWDDSEILGRIEQQKENAHYADEREPEPEEDDDESTIEREERHYGDF